MSVIDIDLEIKCVMSEQNLLVTVIVPVYNVEHYLDTCIKSIVMQSLDCMQIILVDDGSTDSSPLICDQWAEKDKRIHVIHKNNDGVSSARNAGLKIAKGKYIGFVDSDDYIKSDMYQRMMEAAEQTGSDLITCGVCEINGDTKRILSPCINTLTNMEAIRHLLLWDGQITSFVWDKLYRKSILDKIRFNEKFTYGEDTLFVYEYLKYCRIVHHIDGYSYYYIRRDSSLIGNSYSHRKLLSVEAAKVVSRDCKERYLDISEIADCHVAMVAYYSMVSLLFTKEGVRDFHRDYVILKRSMRTYSFRLIWIYYSKITALRWGLCKFSPQLYKHIAVLYKNFIE